MKLHVKLRKLRIEHGWKLRDVAHRTGLEISTVSDYERGRTTPSLKSCQKFADCYALTLEQLFAGVSVKVKRR